MSMNVGGVSARGGLRDGGGIEGLSLQRRGVGDGAGGWPASGGEYPNQKFAGFIAAGSKMTTDQRLTMIQGKIISITGTIELREGKPEIEIVSADQIKVLDSQTER